MKRKNLLKLKIDQDSNVIFNEVSHQLITDISLVENDFYNEYPIIGKFRLRSGFFNNGTFLFIVYPNKFTTSTQIEKKTQLSITLEDIQNSDEGYQKLKRLQLHTNDQNQLSCLRKITKMLQKDLYFIMSKQTLQLLDVSENLRSKTQLKAQSLLEKFIPSKPSLFTQNPIDIDIHNRSAQIIQKSIRRRLARKHFELKKPKMTLYPKLVDKWTNLQFKSQIDDNVLSIYVSIYLYCHNNNQYFICRYENKPGASNYQYPLEYNDLVSQLFGQITRENILELFQFDMKSSLLRYSPEFYFQQKVYMHDIKLRENMTRVQKNMNRVIFLQNFFRKRLSKQWLQILMINSKMQKKQNLIRISRKMFAVGYENYNLILYFKEREQNKPRLSNKYDLLPQNLTVTGKSNYKISNFFSPQQNQINLKEQSFLISDIAHVHIKQSQSGSFLQRKSSVFNEHYSKMEQRAFIMKGISLNRGALQQEVKLYQQIVSNNLPSNQIHFIGPKLMNSAHVVQTHIPNKRRIVAERVQELIAETFLQKLKRQGNNEGFRNQTVVTRLQFVKTKLRYAYLQNSSPINCFEVDMYANNKKMKFGTESLDFRVQVIKQKWTNFQVYASYMIKKVKKVSNKFDFRQFAYLIVPRFPNNPDLFYLNDFMSERKLMINLEREIKGESNIDLDNSQDMSMSFLRGSGNVVVRSHILVISQVEFEVEVVFNESMMHFVVFAKFLREQTNNKKTPQLTLVINTSQFQLVPWDLDLFMENIQFLLYKQLQYESGVLSYSELSIKMVQNAILKGELEQKRSFALQQSLSITNLSDEPQYTHMEEAAEQILEDLNKEGQAYFLLFETVKDKRFQVYVYFEQLVSTMEIGNDEDENSNGRFGTSPMVIDVYSGVFIFSIADMKNSSLTKKFQLKTVELDSGIVHEILQDKKNHQIKLFFLPFIKKLVDLLQISTNLNYMNKTEIQTNFLQAIQAQAADIFKDPYVLKVQRTIQTKQMQKKLDFEKQVMNSKLAQLRISSQIIVFHMNYYKIAWLLKRKDLILKLLVSRLDSTRQSKLISKKSYQIDLVGLKEKIQNAFMNKQKGDQNLLNEIPLIILQYQWLDIDGLVSIETIQSRMKPLIKFLLSRISYQVIGQNFSVESIDNKVQLILERNFKEEKKEMQAISFYMKNQAIRQKMFDTIYNVMAIQKFFLKLRDKEWNGMVSEQMRQNKAQSAHIGVKIHRNFKRINNRIFIVNVYLKDQFYTFDLIEYHNYDKKVNKSQDHKRRFSSVNQTNNFGVGSPLQSNNQPHSKIPISSSSKIHGNSSETQKQKDSIKELSDLYKTTKNKYRTTYIHEDSQLINTGIKSLVEYLIAMLDIQNEKLIFREDKFQEVNQQASEDEGEGADSDLDFLSQAKSILNTEEHKEHHKFFDNESIASERSTKVQNMDEDELAEYKHQLQLRDDQIQLRNLQNFIETSAFSQKGDSVSNVVEYQKQKDEQSGLDMVYNVVYTKFRPKLQRSYSAQKNNNNSFSSHHRAEETQDTDNIVQIDINLNKVRKLYPTIDNRRENLMRTIGGQLISGIQLDTNGQIILDSSKINPHLVKIRNSSIDNEFVAQTNKFQDFMKTQESDYHYDDQLQKVKNQPENFEDNKTLLSKICRFYGKTKFIIIVYYVERRLIKIEKEQMDSVFEDFENLYLITALNISKKNDHPLEWELYPEDIAHISGDTDNVEKARHLLNKLQIYNNQYILPVKNKLIASQLKKYHNVMFLVEATLLKIQHFIRNRPFNKAYNLFQNENTIKKASRQFYGVPSNLKLSIGYLLLAIFDQGVILQISAWNMKTFEQYSIETNQFDYTRFIYTNEVESYKFISTQVQFDYLKNQLYFNHNKTMQEIQTYFLSNNNFVTSGTQSARTDFG